MLYLRALELHTVFHRELGRNERYAVETRVLDFDTKRIHIFHEVKNATEGFLAASFEVVTIHVDLKLRRSKVLPSVIVEQLELLRCASNTLPWPDCAGRRVGLHRKRRNASKASR